MNKKNVALALSSGGPRGFAYIGAIEELEARGYRITSVAGSSVGSLVGGIYAAGGLSDFKEWLYSLDKWNVYSLMDLAISKNHFVKGDKIIRAMQEVVPDVNIEDMNIPYRAIATDLYTGEEVVFDKGKLFTAIRASISIPSLFRPVKYGLSTLIDGGIANCLPLNRVERQEGDLLVAFDVNDVNVEEIKEILRREHHAQRMDEHFHLTKRHEMHELMEEIRGRNDLGLVDRLKYVGSHGLALVKDIVSYEKLYDEDMALDYGDTYYDLLERTFSLQNHRNTALMLQLCPPDILVQMSFDAYGEIADYAKAQEIAEKGRALMSEALNRYEATK